MHIDWIKKPEKIVLSTKKFSVARFSFTLYISFAYYHNATYCNYSVCLRLLNAFFSCQPAETVINIQFDSLCFFLFASFVWNSQRKNHVINRWVRMIETVYVCVFAYVFFHEIKSYFKHIENFSDASQHLFFLFLHLLLLLPQLILILLLLIFLCIISKCMSIKTYCH